MTVKIGSPEGDDRMLVVCFALSEDERGLLGLLETTNADEARVCSELGCIIDVEAVLVSDSATVVDFLSVALEMGPSGNEKALLNLLRATVVDTVVAAAVHVAGPEDTSLLGVALDSVLDDDVAADVEACAGSSLADVVLLRMGQTT